MKGRWPPSPPRRPAGGGYLLRLLPGLLDGPHHVESLLREIIHLPLDDLPEALDGLLHRNVATRLAGELLGHEEGLRQEPLYLPCPGHHQLVLLGELVHPEDGDDVLEVLVAL